MKAHLYLHPSGFSNVADRVIIKKEPCENFSGTAVHAELDLPDGWQVVSTNFGDAIITEKDEIIEKVYPGKLKVSGSAYRGSITIYSSSGKKMLQRVLEWK